MPAPAERMRAMRERRRARGLRELRLVVPDPRLRSVRRRVAGQVASLLPSSENEALNWIEAVSELDAVGKPGNDGTRADVVVVAAAGDYGKPRPAIVVQTDAFPETHASVVVCQMTSESRPLRTFASRSIQTRRLDCRYARRYGRQAGRGST